MSREFRLYLIADLLRTAREGKMDTEPHSATRRRFARIIRLLVRLQIESQKEKK